jgi:hypothetical protein
VTEGLDLADRCATVVQALGWLNWEPNYSRAISELWRLAERYLFLDVRLGGRNGVASVGEQKLALTGEWDGKTVTPYVTVDWPSFAGLLVELHPATILGYGYWGTPSGTVIGIDCEICFATFALEKDVNGRIGNPPTVCIDLPLLWPVTLAKQVRLLPGSQLGVLVPQE